MRSIVNFALLAQVNFACRRVNFALWASEVASKACSYGNIIKYSHNFFAIAKKHHLILLNFTFVMQKLHFIYETSPYFVLFPACVYRVIFLIN